MPKSVFLISTSIICFFTLLSGDQPLRAETSPRYIITGKKSKKEDSKLSPKIRQVLTEISKMGVTRSSIKSFKTEKLSSHLVRVDDSGYVQVYMNLEEVSDENLARLKGLGAKIEIANEKYKIVQGWVPYDKLEEAANLGFVKELTPPSYGKTRTGSVNTEGDAIIGSDDVRSVLGFNGAGVTVGVISDGVDDIALSQGTRDIPNNMIIGDAGEGNEGTALMEIIHDVAPGAGLAFSSGLTSLGFIDSIDFLIDAGADVIIDDLGFLQEPFFEDGMVAEAAADAVVGGVVFVSAAGNDADQHYQAEYVDGGSAIEGLGSVHDFGIVAGGLSDIAMRVLIPALETVFFVLQWNDPFGGSSNDYDLFLFNASTGEEIVRGDDTQNGNDNPIEIVGVENLSPSTAAPIDIVINRFSGQDKMLEIVFGGPVIVQEFNVPEDSIYGHPAATGVIAVGAVPVSSPNTIEFFSSRGPVSIFFPSIETRFKPDLVAPDGVSTSIPDFDPFFGTSASAPHVAGVVALMLDKNPDITTAATVNSNDSGPISVKQADLLDAVLEILSDTAIDLGQAGFDDTFGFGRVNAFDAVDAVGENGGGNNGGGSQGGGCSMAYQTKTGGLISSLIILIPFLVVGMRRVYRKRKMI